MRYIHPAVAAVLLAVLPGCDPRQPVAPLGAQQVTIQGLEQTVRLSPSQPAQGDEIRIVSVVVNRRADSPTVVSRICGLDTGGNLALSSGLMARCDGYSMNAPLGPRDSVTASDVRVVASPPGAYTLRVRHLLLPDTWVEVPVVVH